MTPNTTTAHPMRSGLLLVEEGEAFGALAGPSPATPPPQTVRKPVLVIGGGQAGLSMGYHLRRLGVDFLILDASARIGDAWRRRWDGLRLFTPARYDGLDGMRFPGPRHAFPTKDEMAGYLEAYATRFDLPVLGGTEVTRLARQDGRYIVEAGSRRFEADQVIVAMSSYQQPRLPAFAAALDPAIRQFHAAHYRNPGQLAPGPVLIVGAGNSGAEIAREVAPGRHTIMAGRPTGEAPGRPDALLTRHIVLPLLMRVVFRHVLSVHTPIGRRARTRLARHGGPLIRIKLADLAALGVERTGRIAGLSDGRPQLEDGRILDVANVVWCTGFAPGFDWIDLPIFDVDGNPRHHLGVVAEAPGLYFVGLPFVTALASTMVGGVGRDARRIARRVARSAMRQRSKSAAAREDGFPRARE